MMISGEEALSILRKWVEERTPVKAWLVSGDSVSTVELRGFVDSLTNEGIVISDGKSFIRFNPAKCETFDYLEAKDFETLLHGAKEYLAQQVNESGLSLVTASGTRLSIFAKET